MLILARLTLVPIFLLIGSSCCWSAVISYNTEVLEKTNFRWVIIVDADKNFQTTGGNLWNFPPIDPEMQFWSGTLTLTGDKDPFGGNYGITDFNYKFEGQHRSKVHDDDGATGEPVTLEWKTALAPDFPATTEVARKKVGHFHHPYHHADIYTVTMDNNGQINGVNTWKITIRGSHVVPEPSSIAVFSCLAGLASARRIFQRSRPKSRQPVDL